MQTIDTQKIPLQPGSTILDLGCGQGRHIHGLAQDSRLNLVGMDLSMESARTSLNGLKTYFPAESEHRGTWLVLRGDCLQLPFGEGSFEAVVCAEVLEHIDDYERVLSEIHRILVPGGILAVSVPRFWPERICWSLSEGYRTEPGGHLRIFKARDLKQAISRTGFSCYARHWAHSLHAPYWWLKCLRWSRRESWWPVRLYHRFLVWDMLAGPRLTRWLDRLLNPVCGKSLVLYFQRENSPAQG